MNDEISPRNPPDRTSRVVELEEKIMFQQQTLEDLNAVVLEQQSELNRLRCDFEAFRILVQRQFVRDEEDELPSEKPPHY